MVKRGKNKMAFFKKKEEAVPTPQEPTKVIDTGEGKVEQPDKQELTPELIFMERERYQLALMHEMVKTLHQMDETLKKILEVAKE